MEGPSPSLRLVDDLMGSYVHVVGMNALPRRKKMGIQIWVVFHTVFAHFHIIIRFPGVYVNYGHYFAVQRSTRSLRPYRKGCFWRHH